MWILAKMWSCKTWEHGFLYRSWMHVFVQSQSYVSQCKPNPVEQHRSSWLQILLDPKTSNFRDGLHGLLQLLHTLVSWYASRKCKPELARLSLKYTSKIHHVQYKLVLEGLMHFQGWRSASNSVIILIIDMIDVCLIRIICHVPYTYVL